MLVVKDKPTLKFYDEKEFEQARQVTFDIYLEQEFDPGWSVDLPTEWSVPIVDDMVVSLGYVYTQEVIAKQANTGEFVSFFTQEDAKKALACEEAYEELFTDVLDFFSYNGGFSQQSYEVENSFLHDVKYMLEVHQLFRIQSAGDDEDGIGIRIVVEGNEMIAIDSPLQEVW